MIMRYAKMPAVASAWLTLSRLSYTNTICTSFMLNTNVVKYKNSNNGLLLLSMSSSSYNEVKILKEQPDRPGSNTYWVTPNLLAGEYPGTLSEDAGEEETKLKLKTYLGKKVSYFVDLTGEGDNPDYKETLLAEADYKVSHNRFSINDFSTPGNAEMKRILDAMDNAIENNNEIVYVHCKGGVGRTGTTIGCYLRRHGYEAEEAVEEVNRLFSFMEKSNGGEKKSPENPTQVDFIKNWKD